MVSVSIRLVQLKSGRKAFAFTPDWISNEIVGSRVDNDGEELLLFFDETDGLVSLVPAYQRIETVLATITVPTES